MVKKVMFSAGIILMLVSLIFYIWAGAMVSQKQNVLAVFSAKEIHYGTVIKSIDEAKTLLTVKEVPRYLVADGSFYSAAKSGVNSSMPALLRKFAQKLGIGSGSTSEDIKNQLLSQFVGKIFVANVSKNQQITQGMVETLETFQKDGAGLYSLEVEKNSVGGGRIKAGEMVDVWCNPDGGQPIAILKNVNVADVSDLGEKYLVSFYFSEAEISALESITKKGKVFLVKK